MVLTEGSAVGWSDDRAGGEDARTDPQPPKSEKGNPGRGAGAGRKVKGSCGHAQGETLWRQQWESSQESGLQIQICSEISLWVRSAFRV